MTALCSIAFNANELTDRLKIGSAHGADLASSIGTDNVDNLQLAWSVPIKEYISHTPLVNDGRVFFADWGGNVYAIDHESGEILWRKTVQEKVMKKWPWHGFAGTGTLGEGMLF